MQEKLQQNACYSLEDPQVAAVLRRLHSAAAKDKWRVAKALPRAIPGLLRGLSINEAVRPHFDGAMLAISPEQGRFLYLLARATGACNVVEFGTSFGISTIYLAAAVRDNGGNGKVIGTEMREVKRERAVANLKEAGLSAFAEVRLGDALKTLRVLDKPVDLVLLDGWKDLYIPVLELLRERLRPGAVVVADNIFTFKKALAPYVEMMGSGRAGFRSVTVPFAAGFEYSVKLDA